MIIEFYGPAGSGKSTVAKYLMEKYRFPVIIKISTKKELLWNNFLFFLKQPFKFLKRLSLITKHGSITLESIKPTNEANPGEEVVAHLVHLPESRRGAPESFGWEVVAARFLPHDGKKMWVYTNDNTANDSAVIWVKLSSLSASGSKISELTSNERHVALPRTVRAAL